MKTCIRCRVSQPLDSFHKASSSKDGIHSYCKSCVREKGRIWRAANRERHLANNLRWRAENRDRYRRGYLSRAGWTPEEYDAAFIAQDSLCAICACPDRSSKRQLGYNPADMSDTAHDEIYQVAEQQAGYFTVGQAGLGG